MLHKFKYFSAWAEALSAQVSMFVFVFWGLLRHKIRSFPSPSRPASGLCELLLFQGGGNMFALFHFVLTAMTHMHKS